MRMYSPGGSASGQQTYHCYGDRHSPARACCCDLAGKCTSGLRPLWHGAGGFLFGFVVLHPIAMVIFRWFDPRLAPAMGNIGLRPLLSPILHAFRPEMTAMGLVFGLFSAAIAMIEGYCR